ncbi:Chondroadherin-like protein [Holothuria leucospilota]|uniref:Chondroadherin-like protein n=1 Tax=Holothuria leucospilota TaxID=206669 RepID=A0A9Q1C4I4_HOLLE|nr:Chondroadherin-like protein [Holothuria leucospilota]
MTCREICDYDVSFKRAKCWERNLNTVPSSEGCEESIMLDLQRNHISNFPAESMEGYSNVKTLDLSDNDITEVNPGTFSNMNMLRNILLNGNYLHELKNATFAGTENTLARIYLNENKIAKLFNGVFSGLEALVVLHLNYNKIQSLTSTIFHGLIELKFLQLGMNKLCNLNAVTFKNLTKLKSISLHDNKLTSIPNGLFQGLHSLREVRLSNNAIVAIPSPEHLGIISIQSLYLDNNFTHSSSIKPYLHVTQERLDISHNPFTCDCAFQFIQEWCFNNSEENFVGDPVICILNNIRYNITDPMPFTCETPQATLLSTDPMADLLSETTTQTRDSTTRYHFNTDNMISASKCNLKKCPCNQECSCKNTNEKVEWIAVYCAICLTIFLVGQMLFNTYFIYYLRQKSYRVTEVASAREE